MQSGQRVYHTSTLILGTLVSQPKMPDSEAFTIVADVRWDNGTVTCERTSNLRLDCETCARGCECSGTCATSGCEHYACWGALADDEATCHAAAAHRAATKAAMAARAESRRLPVVWA